MYNRIGIDNLVKNKDSSFVERWLYAISTTINDGTPKQIRTRILDWIEYCINNYKKGDYFPLKTDYGHFAIIKHGDDFLACKQYNGEWIIIP